MEAMTQQYVGKLDTFFIRIYSRDEEIIGAGFLIGWKEIATCAHVVRDALGLDHIPVNAPQADVVLSFPFFDSKFRSHNNERYLLAALHSDGWCPEKDIAILRLDAELPEGANPAKLSIDNTENHSFSVYGFPNKTINAGVWADGVIRKKREHGLVQLESTNLWGYAVQKGFSGGPVFDNELNQVVGMVATCDEHVKVASMIPVDMLVNVCGQHGRDIELYNKNNQVDNFMNIQNIHSREPYEKCLKASFSEREKDDFVSFCMNYIPEVGRKLDDTKSIDRMINQVLDHCGNRNDYSELLKMIRENRTKQYDKFFR